ncbi:putative aldolase LsrF [archaeon BMS3Abin16]|nr:putative aldolase LsrF [archaeon BMS3Abin16]GBE56050.1 putative aldolase LsrF [archaeon BMS3Bbin16]HDY74431.1 3-hydroxy-5-phosphonooxypentane-2,4-dione thiolase [Euryarchaeota archaeon]
MDWGMKNRLSKIIKPKTGRSVMLAVDHGYFLGPTSGLEDFRASVTPLLSFADTLFVTRGMLRTCVDPNTDVPVMLRASGGTSILGKELLHEGVTLSVEDAIRLNAVGIGYSILVGADWERDTILDFARYVDEAERYGLIAMAVTAVGKDMAKDARYLALASRMAAEHGAHMVKTYYCEGFEKVVDTCPVPIVMAGGKKIPELDALTMAFNAVSAGAVGVDMGRNIFQSDSPVAMIQAVRAVVHENTTPKEAFQLFQELSEKEARAGKKSSGVAADDSVKV